MAAKKCAKCSGPMPPHVGPGRPRTVCFTCRPSRAKAAPAAPAAAVTAPAMLEVQAGGLYEATLRELSDSGIPHTAEALAVLALARRIDAGEDTGSGLAAMVKQWHASKAQAMQGVAVPNDPVDELRSRRDRKLAN